MAPLWHWFLALLLSSFSLLVVAESPPHIILIVADDLGFNDVPWHNARVQAPTLQRLAEQGVILEQSYVHRLCSPSRSALMTGRDPYHLGRQHGVIKPLMPTGLTLNYTLLPERLQQAGYRTHIVGKWHLGFCKPEYTPTQRGFETFLGYWLGAEHYFNHTRYLNDTSWGYDFHQNMDAALQFDGQYSSEVFADEAVRLIGEHQKQTEDEPLFLYLPFQSVHGPLEVPEQYWDLYPDVQNDGRRIYLGMVSAMDAAIARVEQALHENGLYNNSLIIFTSDNGGNVLASGNNYPLRGNKDTIWEGGTRGAAFVHSPLLERSGYVSQELIGIADWYPTLLRLAGVPPHPDDASLDGYDQLDTILRNQTSPRTELLYNIDVKNHDVKNLPVAAIRVGDWKLIWGIPGLVNGWYPEPKTPHSFPLTVEDESLPFDYDIFSEDLANNTLTWLFDLSKDPTEHHDLSAEQPELVKQLKQRILELLPTLVPADEPDSSLAGDPSLYGNEFTTGWC